MNRLPLLCRLRGHGWRKNVMPPSGYSRQTCKRCYPLAIPSPYDLAFFKKRLIRHVDRERKVLADIIYKANLDGTTVHPHTRGMYDALTNLIIAIEDGDI